MTDPTSGPGAGMRISATVKWFDPAKGFGFLVPDDGSSDIYFRAPVLTAVGLATLLPGAAVSCETAPTARGPEVSRILTVDFSTAAPRPAPFPQPAGNGRLGAGPDGSGTAGGQVRAFVKWFHADKGYGFLEPEDGSADLFCHISCRAGLGPGHASPGRGGGLHDRPGRQGAAGVAQSFRSSPRSPDPPAPPVRSPGRAPSDPGDRRTAAGPSTPSIRAPQAAVRRRPLSRSCPGTVKFFDPARGFGFVVPDEGAVAKYSSIPACCFVPA